MCTHTVSYATTIRTGLVWKLVSDYLASKGYCLEDLNQLPSEHAKDLMKAASTYASLKLAEIESRSRFVEKIRIKV